MQDSANEGTRRRVQADLGKGKMERKHMSESELKIEDIPCPVCAAPNDQHESEDNVLCKNCASMVAPYWWRWHHKHRRSPPPVQWRTIESAPKENGHHVLLFGDGPGFSQCAVVGYWYEYNEFGAAVGWRVLGHSDNPWYPTHWQPTPAPPGKEQEGVADELPEGPSSARSP